jgi:hypothetical protein
MSGVRMPFQPMLASSGAPRKLAGRWVLEPLCTPHDCAP